MAQGSTIAAEDRSDLIVKAAFARLDLVALSVATGVLLGLLMFLVTAWLLVKEAPSGIHIGPHLGLLANFLPGYSVSWPGSIVGVMYGFLLGAITGGLFGLVWNLAHYVYLIALVGRTYLGAKEI